MKEGSPQKSGSFLKPPTIQPSDSLGEIPSMKDELETIDPMDRQMLEKDLDVDLSDLDMTNEDLDLEEIEDDISLLKKHRDVAKVFEEGGNLGRYTKKIEKDLRKEEWAVLDDYVTDGSTIVELYQEMCASDDILQKFESLLMTFQIDIQSIGSDIKKLQDECLSKEIKIANRKNLNEKLSRFVEGINLSYSLQKNLISGKIDARYMESLRAFDQKIAYIENTKANENSQTSVFKEVDQKVQYILQKVLVRIRQFLLSRIGECTDIGMLKKTHKIFLLLGYVYQFLFKHSPKIANEVKMTYEETATKLFFSYYRNDIHSLSKLQYTTANKNDLLGLDESKTMGFFSGKRTIKNKASVFSIGNRGKFIEELESPKIHMVSISSTERYSYEYLFRTMLVYLMESITEEIRFIQDFFLMDIDVQVGQRMFGRTISLLYENMESHVSNSYDCIGMLVMIVIIQKSRVIMNQRLISLLNLFFESCYQKLIERFFFVFDLNIASVKNALVKDMEVRDLQPHYVTRRYAEFSVAMWHLSTFSEFAGDIDFVKKINTKLERVREEMERFLVRLGETKYKDWTSKSIFFINNYDHILSVFKERDISSIDSMQFQKLLEIKIEDYASYLFNKSFGKLHTFSTDYERLLKPEGSSKEKELEDGLMKKEGEVESLLQDFHDNWKTELEKLQGVLLQQFHNFKCGMQVFQKIMQDLLDSYAILSTVIKKYLKNLRMNRYFIPETELTYEMKKCFVKNY